MEYTHVESSSEPFSHSAPWSPQLMLSPSSDLNSSVQLMYPQHGSVMLDSQRPGTSSSPMHSRPATSHALSLNMSSLSMSGSGGRMQHSPTEPTSPVHNITPQQTMFSPQGHNTSPSQHHAVSYGWYDTPPATSHSSHNQSQGQSSQSDLQSSPRPMLRTKRALPTSMDEATLQETMQSAHSHMPQYPNAHPMAVGLGISHSSSDVHSMGIDPSQVLNMDDDMSYNSSHLMDGQLDDDDVSPDSGSPDPPEPLNLISQHGTGVSMSAIHGGIKLPTAGLEMVHSSSFSVLGRPPPMNNFVTKLYNMILDPKAAPFISWTDHGTSFVVQSITEFSRTILGSHFKHNNFSSFVRQLNMYGFHKINRTPRASRSSTSDQTWEFSHPKFLKGRPDLLEDIKRKALEPDVTTRQRMELPAEVAGQLGRMEGEVRYLKGELQDEKERATKLAGVVRHLWQWLNSVFPGQVPFDFPAELLDSPENPPIYVTSVVESGHPTPTYLSPLAAHGYYTMPMPSTLTPQSTPTTPEFPEDQQQHLPQHDQHGERTQFLIDSAPVANGRYVRRELSQDEVNAINAHASSQRTGLTYNICAAPSALHEPNPRPGPSSPKTLETSLSEGNLVAMHERPVPPPIKTGGRIGPKRQRTNPTPTLETTLNFSGDTLSPIANTTSARKLHRARSDSAPLGYGLAETWSGQGGGPPGGLTIAERRPRSGTNIVRTGRSGGLRTVTTTKVEGNQ